MSSIQWLKRSFVPACAATVFVSPCCFSEKLSYSIATQGRIFMSQCSGGHGQPRSHLYRFCILPKSLAAWWNGNKSSLSLHFCGEISTVTSDQHLRLIGNARCIYRYAYPLGQMTFPLSPNEIFQVIHYRGDALVAEGSIAHQINLAVIVI